MSGLAVFFKYLKCFYIFADNNPPVALQLMYILYLKSKGKCSMTLLLQSPLGSWSIQSMCLWHWRQLYDPFLYKLLKRTYYERFTFSVFAKILWDIWSTYQPMDWIVRQYSQFFVGYLGQTTWDSRSHSGSGLLLTWHGISFECPS